MSDILGGMSNAEEKPEIYLNFKHKAQGFLANGKTPLNFQFLQLDPDTFKSGWGRYANGYEYKWDAKFGAVEERPDETWRRAFSAWVMPHGGNAMLWQSYAFSESTAFNKALNGFWNQIEANAGLLPVIKYEGCKPIQVGQGTSSELNFSFAKWAERADGFAIPEWYIDPDAPADNDDGFVSPNEGLADKVAEMVAKTELSDDDIPF